MLRNVDFALCLFAYVVQALAQRATIKRREGCDEAAREDFERAAALGHRWAAQQAASLNPFAKLCNAMLTEVMKKPTYE